MFFLRLAQLILILAIAALPALAQLPPPVHSSVEPIQVIGQLRYSQSGGPANDVLVRLESLNGGVAGEVRTDRLGKFRFPGLQPLQYHVVIRHPGFQEIRREVNLVMMSAEYLQLALVPDRLAEAALPATKLVLDANVPVEARKEFEKADESLVTGKKEKFPRGILHLERAIKLYPNFLEAHLRLGAACMDLQQWDRAEQALLRALEINPKTANAYFALGEIYWRQGKHAEAERTLREGLVIEDRSWQGHFTLGHVYWEMASKIGDTLHAKPLLEKAYDQVNRTLALNPNLEGAHLLKGNLLLRAGRREKALNEFQEYLRLAPKGEYAAQAKSTVEKLQRQ